MYVKDYICAGEFKNPHITTVNSDIFWKAIYR